MGAVTVRGEIVSAPCTRCGDLACAVYQKATGGPCHHGPREPAPPSPRAELPTPAPTVRKIVPSSVKG